MDIEKAIIGALATPGDVKLAQDEGLSTDIFADPFHAEVVGFIFSYWKASGLELAPTPATLAEEFDREVEVEDSDESLIWLIDKLKRRYRINELQRSIREGAESAQEDPEGTIDRLYRDLWRVRQNVSSHKNRANLAENILDRRESYQQRLQAHSQAAPIGFPEIDGFTGGIRPGEMVTVAGYAKQGKSWTLVNAAVEARKQGYTPYVATLELDVDTFSERIDAVFSGIGYGKLSRGHMVPSDFDRLHAAQEEMAELGPIYVENPVRQERTAEDLVSRARQLGCDYVIIDQLSWIEAEENHRTRQDTYKEILETLKLAVSSSAEGPLPLLLAVQFNRNAGPKGRGGMENMADASEIERIADYMFGLYRTEEMRADDSIVLELLGSRRTDKGAWLLNWELDQRCDFHVRGEYRESDRA